MTAPSPPPAASATPPADPHARHRHGDGHEHEHNHGHQHAALERPLAPDVRDPHAHRHDAGAGDHPAHAGQDHSGMVEEYRRRFWVSLALTVPILALSPTIRGLIGLGDRFAFPASDYVSFVLSAAVFFYGGWPFLTGLVSEVRARQPGMMTLISLAISVAFAYSTAVVFGLSGGVFFWELATLIDIMLLGHWIEMRSVLGASGALQALVQLLPSVAHRIESGVEKDVPVASLKPGDRVHVRPGEKVPIDGLIIDGASSFNEAMLTGESRPVEKSGGSEVIGGALNGEGAVTVEVRKTGDATYLAQVIDLVRRAQETRSRTQDIANRAALWLTIIAIGAGAFTFIAWLVLGEGLSFALERTVTVMVITCPHALGLAVPLVVAVSTTLAAQSGLLIRDRAAFERAREVKAVVFDKTGTLTEGRFGVAAIVPLAEHSADDVLATAAALEAFSEHPIARSIVVEANRRQLRVPPASGFRNLTGQGAEGEIGGHRVRVVSPGYLRAHNVQLPDNEGRLSQLMSEGKTVVIVLTDEQPIGALALADIVRPESGEAIRTLSQMGIQSMMLTGDAKPVADSVGKELGLSETFAEVLPAQKAAKVAEIKTRGLTVAMVGDGVNDAPALVESDLGVAIGAGTDVAIESADVVLVRNDPRDVVSILSLSRATYNKMVQNLFWATGYNAFAIPLAAGVGAPWGLVLSPAAGAVLMSLSTIIVAINAQLLARRFRRSHAA